MDVAHAVKNQLSSLMSEFGYQIMDVLVTDLEPDRQVKAAMNQINGNAPPLLVVFGSLKLYCAAQQRLRESAAYKAEADKILQVKSAEADAESKYLSGLGVARQRKAVVDGLKESVTEFTTNVPGTTAEDVMDLLLVTQYFDTIKDLGKSTGTAANTLFLPHGPQAVSKLRAELDKEFMVNLSQMRQFS